jgi:membrane protein
MAAGTARAAAAPERRWAVRVATARDLAFSTVSICLRYRVTGLAAEVGFFALLSLPPLVLGLVGSLGYFADVLGPDVVAQARQQIVQVAESALASDVVRQVIIPTLDDVLNGGRVDIISLGFLLALWSGSRALNVCVDTITIMYGLGGRRGIVATRVLSFSLYVVALVVGVVVAPLVLVGPSFVARALPPQLDALSLLYWPIVTLLSVAFLTTLYHVSVPVRGSWLREMPGAGLAVVGWLLGSYVLRLLIRLSVGGTSIYGPLAASIVVLLWLYVLALMVLIGAALNAAVDRRWPSRTSSRPPVMRTPAPAPENPMTHAVSSQ